MASVVVKRLQIPIPSVIKPAWNIILNLKEKKKFGELYVSYSIINVWREMGNYYRVVNVQNQCTNVSVVSMGFY